MVFETSVSTKAEPHHPAENPKGLLHKKQNTWEENVDEIVFQEKAEIIRRRLAWALPSPQRKMERKKQTNKERNKQRKKAITDCSGIEHKYKS